MTSPQRLSFFVFFLLLCSVSFAAELRNAGNISGSGIYTIYNFTNITATRYCFTGGTCFTSVGSGSGSGSNISIGNYDAYVTLTTNGTVLNGSANLTAFDGRYASLSQFNNLSWNVSELSSIVSGHTISISSLQAFDASIYANVSALPAGSGTTNRSARWTASNTLSTGSFYDNGSLVGLGNTAPNASLDVSGVLKSLGLNVTCATGCIIQLNDGSSTVAIWGTSLGLLSEDGVGRITTPTNNITFHTGGTRNSFTQGTHRGQVGADGWCLNCSDANASLDVVGDITFTGSVLNGTWTGNKITDSYITNATGWNAKAGAGSATCSGSNSTHVNVTMNVTTSTGGVSTQCVSVVYAETAETGDISSVSVGNGLSGGGTSGAVTVSQNNTYYGNHNTVGIATATNFSGQISCLNITGGSDSDFCADANTGGGSGGNISGSVINQSFAIMGPNATLISNSSVYNDGGRVVVGNTAIDTGGGGQQQFEVNSPASTAQVTVNADNSSEYARFHARSGTNDGYWVLNSSSGWMFLNDSGAYAFNLTQQGLVQIGSAGATIVGHSVLDARGFSAQNLTSGLPGNSTSAGAAYYSAGWYYDGSQVQNLAFPATTLVGATSGITCTANVNGSCNWTVTASGTGNITGTNLTANYYPIATSATNLQSSNLTQDAGTLVINAVSRDTGFGTDSDVEVSCISGQCLLTVNQNSANLYSGIHLRGNTEDSVIRFNSTNENALEFDWETVNLANLTSDGSFNVRGNITARNFTGKLQCVDIVGGSDGDFCADATGAGGNTTVEMRNAVNNTGPYNITIPLGNLTGSDTNACTSTDKVTSVNITDGNLIINCAVDVGGSGSPGGAASQIQYHGTGGFAGNSNFTYDNSTNDLSVLGGNIIMRDPVGSGDRFVLFNETTLAGFGYLGGNNRLRFAAGGGTMEFGNFSEWYSDNTADYWEFEMFRSANITYRFVNQGSGEAWLHAENKLGVNDTPNSGAATATIGGTLNVTDAICLRGECITDLAGGAAAARYHAAWIDDFYGGSTEAGEIGMMGWDLTVGGTGAAASYSSHRGDAARSTLNLTSGSSNGGNVTVMLSALTMYVNATSGLLSQYGAFSVGPNALGTSNNITLLLGFGDNNLATAAGQNQTDSIALLLNTTQGNNNLSLITRSNGGAQTTNTTSFAIVPNEMLRYNILIYNNTKVELYINEVLLAESTTNIPSGNLRAFGPQIKLIKTGTNAGTAAISVGVDYYGIEHDFETPR